MVGQSQKQNQPKEKLEYDAFLNDWSMASKNFESIYQKIEFGKLAGYKIKL